MLQSVHFLGVLPPGPRYRLRSRARHVVSPLPLPGKFSMGADGLVETGSDVIVGQCSW